MPKSTISRWLGPLPVWGRWAKDHAVIMCFSNLEISKGTSFEAEGGGAHAPGGTVHVDLLHGIDASGGSHSDATAAGAVQRKR